MFTFPDKVRGWLTPSEGAFLARLAEGKDVLELGSYAGLSTICLAQTARHVVCVDTFDGRTTPEPGPTFSEFLTNIVRAGVHGKVDAIQGTFDRIVPALTGTFDLAFIDGAHDPESTRIDAGLALSKLKPGGILAFDDYDSPYHPTVKPVVDGLLVSNGGEFVEIVGEVAAVRVNGRGQG